MADHLWPRVRRALVRRLGVDARALAALRVAVGALLLADLALRARSLTALYTDAGVLPRAVLREQYPAFANVSVHALSGAVWFEVLLFALAGIAALALVAGYRTRLAVLASWVLLASLHARNPLVLSAGDSLLRRLLFWSLFLPLGARWSVDALHRSDARRPEAGESKRGGTEGRETAEGDWVAGVASAALLVQVLLVYAVNAVLKLRGDLWLSGDAIRYVFSLDQFLVGIGPALAQYPGLLEALSHVWLAMLALSPLLVVLTGWPRAAFAGLFAAMHLGMAVTMLLGVFPFISIAAVLPFLPPAFWDALEARTPPSAAQRLTGWRTRLAARLPAAQIGVPDALSQGARRAAPVVAAAFLVVMLAWNAAALGLVGVPEEVSAAADPEERTWDMFAPEPMSVDGWYVVPGELESGERVDAFHGGPVEWNKPPDVSETYPTWRWRKYLVDLWRADSPALRRGFAGYLCEQWNATHGDGLVRVAPHYVTQETRLEGPEPVERVLLVEHSCGPERAGS